MVEAFTYEQQPCRVVFGAGAVAGVADEVDRLGAGTAFVVASASAAGSAQRIGSALGDRCAGTIPRARPHVPEEDAVAAAATVARADAGCVVAVGGGSAIGLAKAIALRVDVVVCAVPTTYSGSEMTSIYGVTSRGRKRTGRDPRVRPAAVVYDPLLTLSLPPRPTAGTGMNAVAHCVEALYAPGVDPVTAGFAEAGLRALRPGLTGSIERPADAGPRGVALYGSFLAGLALSGAAMGLHHRICHVLGGTLGVGHGDANAVMLPWVVRFNAPAAPAAMARVAAALGGGDAVALLEDLAARLGAPRSLSDLGVDPARLDDVAGAVVDVDPPGPRPVDRSAVARILRSAYAGRDSG